MPGVLRRTGACMNTEREFRGPTAKRDLLPQDREPGSFTEKTRLNAARFTISIRLGLLGGKHHQHLAAFHARIGFDLRDFLDIGLDAA